MKRVHALVFACALAVAGSTAALALRASASPRGLPPPPPQVLTGVRAPDVQLEGKGGRVSLQSEIQGSPSVVVLFRGSWCPYCRKELGRLAQALEQHPSTSVKVIGISSEPSEELAAFQQKVALPFELLSDHEDRTAAICHFAMHCVLLYDAHGVLRWAGYAESWHAPVDYGAVLRAAGELR